MWRNIIYTATALPLAAFMAFVGWHKSFSSMADLARYGAYTAHLPEWIGRIAGLCEMLSALALIVGLVPKYRLAVPAAGVFIILSQIVSSIIHVQFAETGALLQNSLLALASALLVWLARNPNPRPN